MALSERCSKHFSFARKHCHSRTKPIQHSLGLSLRSRLLKLSRNLVLSTGEMATESKEALRERIEQNPGDYDAYRELLKLVEDDKIAKHSVLTKFSENFPLDEATWLDWIAEIERSPALCSNIGELYERSIKDYFSIRLICKLCHYKASLALDVDAKRAVFKHHASLYGGHFTQGHLLWDSWVALELSFGENGNAEYPRRRKACTPLKGIVEFWTEYELNHPEFALKYRDLHDQALKQVMARAEMEEMIQSIRLRLGLDQENPGSPVTASSIDLEGKWLAYIEDERKSNPKKKHSILFERALGDCCLSENLWSMYCGECESTQDASIQDTCLRALRNIPTGSPAIFSVLIRASPVDKAQGIFERAKVVLSLADLTEPIMSLVAVAVKANSDHLESICQANLDLLKRGLKRHDDRIVQAFVSILLAVQAHPWSLTLWSPIIEAEKHSPMVQASYVEVMSKHKTIEQMRLLFPQVLHSLYGSAEGFNMISAKWLALEMSSATYSPREFAKAKAAIDSKRAKSVTKPEAEDAKKIAKEDIKSRRGKAKEINAEAIKVKPEMTDNGERQPKRSRIEEELELPGTKPVTEKTGIAPMKIKENPEKNIVFLPSLPDSATIESVKDFFTRLVKVPGCFVDKVQIKQRQSLVHPVSKEPLTRLYGFVEFGGETSAARAEAASKAVKLSGSDLDGFDVTILLAEPPKKKYDDINSTTSSLRQNSEPPKPIAPIKSRTPMVPRAVKVNSKLAPTKSGPPPS